ncbi:MAG: type II toxin-antitoxin system VapC family toxin [Spirochaetaceae bacterium]|nr:type II toxin-antitoxin system VapC family toxin [Spirochaetaceae bacterium]
MTWLLDTSVCIPLINRSDTNLAARLLGHTPGSICLCSVVKAELHFGAQNSRRIAENLRRLETFFGAFPSLPFDDDAAKHYGTIRAQLRREGRPIGANDLMIAAIALAGSLMLATRDVEEFERVPGLKVEGW